MGLQFQEFKKLSHGCHSVENQWPIITPGGHCLYWKLLVLLPVFTSM